MVPTGQAKHKKWGNWVIQARHSQQRRPCSEARAFKGLDTQAAPWSVPLHLKDSSSWSLHSSQVSSQAFQSPVERFGLAGRKIEFFSVCVMWTHVRKEVGQTLGVVILTGCVPLIIRELLSPAAFASWIVKRKKFKVPWNRGMALNTPAGMRVPVCG